MTKTKWSQKPIHALFAVALVLSLSLVMAVPAQAFVALHEHYNTGDNSISSGPTGAAWYAQTFTAESDHGVTSVRLKLARYGYPGTVVVSIRATNASGHPTGTDLALGTTNGNTLTTDTAGEWREITLLPSYHLTSGNMYAIVIRAPDGNSSNYLRCRYDFAPSDYAGGDWVVSPNNGVYWEVYDNFDLMFEIYEWGAPPTPIVNEPSVVNGFTSIAPFLETAYGFKVGEGTGGWTIYNPDWPSGANTLTTLYVARGYWISVSETCTLQYGSSTYLLDAGWNLIGWIPQL
jgi:hypothetical protein